MRLRHVLTSFAVGLAARAIVRRRRARAVAHSDVAPDPADPVQNLDEPAELQVDPLAFDAVSQADVEAAQDLASLEVHGADQADQIDSADTAGGAPDVESDTESPVRRRDAGELYGAHTPAAVDRTHPDDDAAFEDGQNWIEALETDAVENGAEPEKPLDEIIDDEDALRPPHASDRRDTPVADHGAGGTRGL